MLQFALRYLAPRESPCERGKWPRARVALRNALAGMTRLKGQNGARALRSATLARGHFPLSQGDSRGAAQFGISFSRMLRLHEFSGLDKRRRSHSAECRLTHSARDLRSVLLLEEGVVPSSDPKVTFVHFCTTSWKERRSLPPGVTLRSSAIDVRIRLRLLRCIAWLVVNPPSRTTFVAAESATSHADADPDRVPVPSICRTRASRAPCAFYAKRLAASEPMLLKRWGYISNGRRFGGPFQLNLRAAESATIRYVPPALQKHRL
jgi:hypothetical protein